MALIPSLPNLGGLSQLVNGPSSTVDVRLLPPGDQPAAILANQRAINSPTPVAQTLQHPTYNQIVAPANGPGPAQPGGGGAPPPAAPSVPSLLNMLPGYQNALALEQQGIGQLDAALRSARERAIINFGDPALASMAGFGIDPQAGAFARQNYLSGNATLARLDRQHRLAAQAIVNQLASHGILNSGDLGYLQGQENQGYGNNVYDAQQQVLDQLSNLYQNYLSSRMGFEQNVNQALQQALADYVNNPDAYASLLGISSNAPAQPKPVTSITPPKAVTKRRTAAKTVGGRLIAT